MTSRRFVLILGGLCLFYAALETAYVLRLPLVMDEFQGASAVHQLTEGLPYRDFTPYKTVLGYYIQLPVLSSVPDTWNALLAVKFEMVAINTVAIFLAALWLARRFDRRAVLVATALLVTMSTFLERSPDLRVDMLTALFGLAALLLLLERRWLWAGAVCAASFFVSQKGAYYLVASNAALLGLALMKRDRLSVRALAGFNIAAAAVAATYVGAWSVVASPGAVLSSAVADAGRVATDHIQDIRLRYWGGTLRYNALFYLLGLFSFWQLDKSRRAGSATTTEWTLLLYGLTLALLTALHKQPWPYFFVLLIPTLWVLNVWLFHDRRVWFGKLDRAQRRWTLLGFVVLGLFNPLSRIPANLSRDSGFQRHMVRMAEHALGDDETYLSGVDVLWNRDQVTKDLTWLDRLQLAWLHEAPVEELDRLRSEIETRPLAVVIDNYRTQQLPLRVRIALDSNYGFYWGNLRLYAPALRAGESRFHLSISGRYRWMDERSEGGTLDGRPIAAGEIIALEAGAHTKGGPAARLALIPPGLDAFLDERYQKPRSFFPDVYDY